MYIPLQITLDMQFTLSEILTLLTFLGTLATVWFNLRKQIVQLQSSQREDEKKITKLEVMFEKEKDKRDVDQKELWQKLVEIESSQNKTNVFLEENLKAIKTLLDLHDKDITMVKDKMDQQEKNMLDFYKTYKSL